MIFLEDRRDLEKRIYANLFHKSAPVIAKNLLKKLQDDGVLRPEEVLYITGDSRKLELFDDRKLFSLAKIIADNIPGSIRLKDYFMDWEIRSFSISPSPIKKNPLVFEHAFKLAENQWSCIASVEDLAMLANKGLVRADPSFQRESKTYTDSNERVFEIVHVNRKRVEEIKELIINNEFYFNTIRLSVINDGSTPSPVFDEDDKTVSINKKSPIIIIDGNHRFLAASSAYWAAPNEHERFRNSYFNLIISFLTPNQTRDCIYQEWNTEPIAKRHKASVKTAQENVVVEKIRASEDSDPLYANRIVTHANDPKGRIFFDALAAAVKTFYLTEEAYSKNELMEISNWIIEFFNHCVKFLKEPLQKNNYRGNWGCTSLAWTGLIALSKKLKGRDNWKEITDDLLKDIDWSQRPIDSMVTNTQLKYWEERWKEV